ncbi:hypothetical protein CBFG_04032 [Clostridiales bacterium 1_7_47FAA]|nr:hypothetical protein CBFG_04032 [Clostridiales bacterium 1_7_47FAA]
MVYYMRVLWQNWNEGSEIPDIGEYNVIYAQNITKYLCNISEKYGVLKNHIDNRGK